MIGLGIAQGMYRWVQMVVEEMEKRMNEEDRVNCGYGRWECKRTRESNIEI